MTFEDPLVSMPVEKVDYDINEYVSLYELIYFRMQAIHFILQTV